MEDDLKKLNVEYLSNHWPILPQILNIVLGNQTKIENCLKWDNLQWKKVKVEYLSNLLFDLTQIWK